MNIESKQKGALARTARTLFRRAAKALEDARPLRPRPELFTQGQSFADYLLPDDSVDVSLAGSEEDTTLFLMKDGAIGVGLWLEPIGHELLEERTIATRLDGLARSLTQAGKGGRVEGLSFQVIFDAEPDLDAPPSPSAPPDSFAGRLFLERAAFLGAMARTRRAGLRLFKRRILLCVRLEGDDPLAASGEEEAHASRAFARRVQVLSDVLATLRAGLKQNAYSPQILAREELLSFLRDSLHSISMRESSSPRHRLASKASRPLGEQALYHAVSATPFGVGVGEDCWQAASLIECPESASLGLVARLLAIDSPHRVVVNMRPLQKGASLSFKRAVMTHARDAQGIRMRDDLDALDGRMQSDEGLFSFSWHLFVRNENLPLERLADETAGEDGSIRAVVSTVAANLSALVREERHCAPLVFAACLPFQNDPRLVSLVGRELLVPSLSLVSLLPIFGGFRGTSTPMLQMVGRAGSRVFLNPRDASGASHLAILGGTGGGKSFLTANLVTSFLARHPEGRAFIIDKKTSYAVLAKLAAEEASSAFLRPPANFPNIFQGGSDAESLPALVALLQTAITLVSPRADFSAMETSVLGEALTMTFAEKERQAAAIFDEESAAVVGREALTFELPRLSDIVSNLHPAADALEFPSTIAVRLSEWLSPFVGTGPYARFFDVPATRDANAKAPMITLCDLDGVANDPILLVLTVQALILDIMRLLRPKDEMTPNPPSLLIVEEVGVLAGESPALVAFIRSAWKTLRKYQVTCVGLTNSVTDYADVPGPSEIWNVSPNKIIMPQLTTAVNNMAERIRNGGNGLVPSALHCDVLKSLVIDKGSFSDGLWMSPEIEGTFSYIPTGFDAWCAASDPSDLATVASVVRELKGVVKKPVLAAVRALAHLYPSGIRVGGHVRIANDEEILAAVAFALKAERAQGEVSS